VPPLTSPCPDATTLRAVQSHRPVSLPLQLCHGSHLCLPGLAPRSQRCRHQIASVCLLPSDVLPVLQRTPLRSACVAALLS
jgi:hypothetical protein